MVNPTPRHADRSTVARLDLLGPMGSGGGQGSPRGHGCPGCGCLASVSERGSRAWRPLARADPAVCAAGGGRSGQSLTVEVDDCATTPDTFSITAGSYSNSGPLIGGNIKIH